MMREVIIMRECKVYISLNFTLSKKKRGAGLKKIKKLTTEWKLHTKFWADKTL